MKKIIIIPALVGVLGIGIVASSTTLLTGSAKEQKLLTMQEIEKKALAIVKGTVTDIEFDREYTGDVYEVEIITATEEHDLKFDAYTGKLLKQKKEALDYDDYTYNSTAVKITKEQAIKTALSKAQGTVTKVKLDHGVYEIEIVDGQLEYDVDIHATTGEVVGFKQEEKTVDYDDDTAYMQTGNSTAVKITKEQAIKTALSKAQGTVTKVELDDGVYEIEIEDGQFEYEIDIHATTGEIVGFEQDQED